MDPLVAAYFETVLAAFPPSDCERAMKAAQVLRPYVDSIDSRGSFRIQVLGESIEVPPRVRFARSLQEGVGAQDKCTDEIMCLYSRSNDGFQRQAALRKILTVNKPWSIPYVVLLSGENVVEIIRDMVDALPAFDREGYGNFVFENRALVGTLRARATSYWNCYYRYKYPDRRAYPGLDFLDRLEEWAR